jgi:hypothetical protein
MANQEAIQMIPIPSPLKESSSSSYLEMSIHPLTSFAEDISKLCQLCHLSSVLTECPSPGTLIEGELGITSRETRLPPSPFKSVIGQTACNSLCLIWRPRWERLRVYRPL